MLQTFRVTPWIYLDLEVELQLHLIRLFGSKRSSRRYANVQFLDTGAAKKANVTIIVLCPLTFVLDKSNYLSPEWREASMPGLVPAVTMAFEFHIFARNDNNGSAYPAGRLKLLRRVPSTSQTQRPDLIGLLILGGTLKVFTDTKTLYPGSPLRQPGQKLRFNEIMFSKPRPCCSVYASLWARLVLFC
jgi:hypothetical protein